jgi:hypothetical protein
MCGADDQEIEKSDSESLSNKKKTLLKELK